MGESVLLKGRETLSQSEYWRGSQEQHYFYYVAQGGILRQWGYWGEPPASPSVELEGSYLSFWSSHFSAITLDKTEKLYHFSKAKAS